MADYVVTAANVVASLAASTRVGIAGATITQGQYLYKDTSDSNKLKLAVTNGSSLLRVVEGVALDAGSAGQPIKYAVTDPGFVPGFTTAAAGDIIVLSRTAGAAAHVDDPTTGDYVTVLGVMTSATTMNLQFTAAGAAKP